MLYPNIPFNRLHRLMFYYNQTIHLLPTNQYSNCKCNCKWPRKSVIKAITKILFKREFDEFIFVQLLQNMIDKVYIRIQMRAQNIYHFFNIKKKSLHNARCSLIPFSSVSLLILRFNRTLENMR